MTTESDPVLDLADSASKDPAADELARLRAENAELRSRVASTEEPRRPPRSRGILATMLVVLAAVAFSGASVGVWVRRSLLNEEVFAARVVPLAQDPAVKAAISTRMTTEIFSLVDPQALFEEVLPERGKMLAGPLSTAVENFVGEQVTTFVASSTFEDVWAQVATRGHTRMIEVVEGRSEVISAQGDNIVINLVPLINRVLAQIGQISPQLFGRTIDIPALTVNDIPEAARQRLGSMLGKDLSPEFGVIEISGGGEAITNAQRVVRGLNVFVWVLGIATIVLIPLALWVSPRRRRTLLQLCAALAVGTVLVRRSTLVLEGEALSLIPEGVNRQAADAVAAAFVDPLFATTRTILWVLAAIAVIAAITGPYPWAVRVRSVVGRGVGAAAAVVERGTSDARSEPAVAWVNAHRGILQAAGAILGLAVLWLVDLSWFGIVVVLALLGGYLAALWWLTKDTATEPAPPSPPPGPGMAAT